MYLSRLEAIASRLEAIALRLEAIASRLEPIARRPSLLGWRPLLWLEAIATRQLYAIFFVSLLLSFLIIEESQQTYEGDRPAIWSDLRREFRGSRGASDLPAGPTLFQN